MVVYDIYSKRQSGKSPDVYQYKELPQPFRHQLVYILRDILGQIDEHDFNPSYSPSEQWYRQVHDILVREYGVPQLHERGNYYQDIVFNFILAADVLRVLDVIQLSFRLAYVLDSRNERLRSTPNVVKNLDEAVEELNARFREHGIGYQFESHTHKIMRVDSEFLHQEVVKPSLHLLRAPHFAGAEEEFHKAHKHYREQEFEGTISESLKALESTLKVICTRKGWSFSERDTASKLIQIVFDHELIPNYLQSQFNGLRTILEGGVPTIRNRDGGHGTGATPRRVPAHLAAYVLHQTASAIVFLTEAAKK